MNLKKEVTRKQSSPNFPKIEHFLPSYTHTYVCVPGVRNIRFSENLVSFVFLLPPSWDSPFFPYYQRIKIFGKTQLESLVDYVGFCVVATNMLIISCFYICTASFVAQSDFTKRKNLWSLSFSLTTTWA